MVSIPNYKNVKAVPYDRTLAKYILHMFKDNKVPDYDISVILGMLKYCEKANDKEGISVMEELIKYIDVGG